MEDISISGGASGRRETQQFSSHTKRTLPGFSSESAKPSVNLDALFESQADDEGPRALFSHVMPDFPIESAPWQRQGGYPVESADFQIESAQGKDSKPANPDSERALKLVQALGSEAFETREKATRELTVLGKSAFPALAIGLRSGDLEVKRRAEEIVGRELGFDRIERDLLTAKYGMLEAPTGERQEILKQLSDYYRPPLRAAKLLNNPEVKDLLKELSDRPDLALVKQADSIKKAAQDLRLDYAACLIHFAEPANPATKTKDFSQPFTLAALRTLATALNEDPRIQENPRFQKLCAFAGVGGFVDLSLSRILNTAGDQPARRMPVGPLNQIGPGPQNDNSKENGKDSFGTQPSPNAGDALNSIETFAKLAFARMKLSTLSEATMRNIRNYHDNNMRFGTVEEDPEIHSPQIHKGNEF